jgi:hypothetical protein
MVYVSNPSYLGGRDQEDCGEGWLGQLVCETSSQAEHDWTHLSSQLCRKHK